MNDTGSAILSLFDTDMLHLGNDQGYTGWINEWAIIKPGAPNVPRLSGVGIRDVLYLGTAPGNQLLAVATTKGGMTSFALKSNLDSHAA